MKTISNNIIHYKLLALIPLALAAGGVAWWDVSEKGGLLIPILIAVAGIISFIVVLFKTENTVILTYNTENGTVHIQKNKELIVVPIHDILSFRKEVDFQHSYLDFLKENYTVYGVTLLHDGKKEPTHLPYGTAKKHFRPITECCDLMPLRHGKSTIETAQADNHSSTLPRDLHPNIVKKYSPFPNLSFF